jgi:hypothetical protein
MQAERLGIGRKSTNARLAKPGTTIFVGILQEAHMHKVCRRTLHIAQL